MFCLLFWLSLIALDYFLHFGILICSFIRFPFLILTSAFFSLFWQFSSCSFLSFWAPSPKLGLIMTFGGSCLTVILGDLRDLVKQGAWFSPRFQGCVSVLLLLGTCRFILALPSGNIWGHFLGSFQGYELASSSWLLAAHCEPAPVSLSYLNPSSLLDHARAKSLTTTVYSWVLNSVSA